MSSKWVKPFSSGMSCLETVDGECLTHLSEKECEEYCANHPFCDTGYYVKYSNKQYCIPLNGLSMFGRNKAFDRSTFDSKKSVFFHPSLGVSIKVFQNKKNIHPEELFQKYVEDPFIVPTYIQNTRTMQYLTKDLKMTTDKSESCLWYIYRFIYNFSGDNSSEYDRISNGEIVTFRTVDSDESLLYRENQFELILSSILMGFSTTYNYENVYYFQIFQDNDLNYVIDPYDHFAIRINQLPLTAGDTFFMDVKENNLIAVPIFSVDDIKTKLEEYRVWKFLPTSDDKLEYPDENFIDSQWHYANMYLGASMKDPPKNKINIWVMIFIIILVVIIIIFYVR